MQRRFLLAVFVVSGFTGLIYESIWSHYLKLFLGHAAYAQTLVLAIFMGGMALGSWAVARYSARLRYLLWAYVLVEGLIGLLGIIFHRTFVVASDFSFATVIPSLPSGLLIDVYKWSLAALLILPQSVLLGMTFPLISGGLIRRWPDRPGETLATLYFTNSLGAAIGVLVSGFILIKAVGLPGTVLTAGLLNVMLALVVWSIVRRQTEPAPAPQAPAASSAPDTLARWFVLAAFLTGAASFMYELGWIRMLSLVLSSSTHSFELMLSAFIFGLAFGGLYVRRRIARIADPATYVGGVMVVMGALAALTLPAYNLTFDFMSWCLAAFTRTENGYVAFNLISQSIAALIMIPTTFCAGMTLPLLTQELMRRGTGERAIGTIYSVNTLGAIVGVLLTVHILMPLVGVKGVILGGAGIHMALGLSRLLAVRRQRPRAAAVATAAGLLVLVLTLFVVNLDPLRMASGVYRTGLATLPVGTKVAYFRDGKTATISLVEKDGVMVIATNGKPDAGVQIGQGRPTADESTVLLAAAMPLSMHPNPRRVANIGFGSGLTAHMLLNSPLVERLDTIEIEPFMVEAARQGFGPRIGNVFDDQRSHIIYEDAKTFFATAREPYDLIVSEPSNPWVSGVATLFSDEFYGRITQYLRPDGYFVQWIQTYETSMEVVASVIKAMAPHFDAYAIYNSNDSDILIIATRGAALPTPDDRIFQSPQMRTELERVGVQGIEDLRLRKIADNRTIGPLVQRMSAPANSDFFPFVDLNAPRLRFIEANANELANLTDMPIPFIELISGGGAPSAPTIEPSVNSGLYRDYLVRRALAIRRAILDRNLTGLDPSVASFVMLIDAGRDICADAMAQNAWKLAIQNISARTAPYLSAADQEPIWNKITSSPCYAGAAIEQKNWADLYAAISQRNAPGIVKFTTVLLAPQTPNSGSDLAYLTTITAAAYVHMGQIAQAHSLLEEQLKRFDHSGPFWFPLLELQALTQSSGAEASAHTH
ncbi:MAG: spermidine synthase [Steroidobacteraceae bacterium]